MTTLALARVPLGLSTATSSRWSPTLPLRQVSSAAWAARLCESLVQLHFHREVDRGGLTRATRWTACQGVASAGSASRETVHFPSGQKRYASIAARSHADNAATHRFSRLMRPLQ